MNEQTLPAVARNNVDSTLPTFERCFASAETKASTRLLGAMALQAGSFKERLNLFGKIHSNRRSWRELTDVNLSLCEAGSS
jgi:hypothetical protein